MSLDRTKLQTGQVFRHDRTLDRTVLDMSLGRSLGGSLDRTGLQAGHISMQIFRQDRSLDRTGLQAGQICRQVFRQYISLTGTGLQAGQNFRHDRSLGRTYFQACIQTSLQAGQFQTLGLQGVLQAGQVLRQDRQQVFRQDRSLGTSLSRSLGRTDIEQDRSLGRTDL